MSSLIAACFISVVAAYVDRVRAGDRDEMQFAKLDPTLGPLISGVPELARRNLIMRAGSAGRGATIHAAEPGGLQADVTVHFRLELSSEEVGDRETDGLEFRRLPNGHLANVGRFYPAWATRAAILRLAGDSLVVWIEPGCPPRLAPPLETAVPEVEGSVRHEASLGGAIDRRNLGRGVVIANFDTGIDITHPDFFRVDDATEPYEWIDTDGNGSLDPGTDCVDVDEDGLCGPAESIGVIHLFGFSDPSRDWYFVDANGNGDRDFGRDAGFTEADPTYGERFLIVEHAERWRPIRVGQRFLPLGESKVRAALGPGGRVYRRGVDLIDAPGDTNGHGTSVASILVSQVAGEGRIEVGVAPGAELLSIDRYANTNYISNLAWARSEGASVFLWEFGGWTHTFLDGTTALEQAITAGMARFDVPEVHVIPNGNLGGSSKHARVELPGGDSAVVTLSIGATAPAIETLWISAHWRGPAGQIAFELGSAGDALAPLALGQEVLLSNGVAFLSHVAQSVRGWNRIEITLTNRGPEGRLPITTGAWSLQLTNGDDVTRTVDLYVADDKTTWSGGARWTSHATDEGTITWPATADSGVSVAAYSGENLTSFSGRGPVIDGRPDILDVAAPGYVSTVARSSASEAGFGFYHSFSGTSAAGPFVAGAAALLLEAVPPQPGVINGDLIGWALRQGAAAPAPPGGALALPNDEWGYGKLRIDAAYQWLSERFCPDLAELTGEEPADESSVSPGEGAVLRWNVIANAEAYDVYFGRSNPPPLAFPALTSPAVETGPLEPGDLYFWRVVARNECGDPSEHPGGPASDGALHSFYTGGDLFRRGDCNSDGFFDLSDPITLLLSMFAPDRLALPFRCSDACDFDDNGQLSVTDALNALTRLTIGGAPPAAPFPGCGLDVTPDSLDCFAYAYCR